MKPTLWAGLLILIIAIGAGAYLKISDTVILPAKQIESSVAATLRVLEERYIYPEVALDMKRAVESKVSSGAYDGLSTNFGLIKQLNGDLRSVANDLHIALSPFRDNKVSPQGPVKMRNQNYGVGGVRMLPNQLAYIEIEAFPFGNATKDALTKAIESVSDANAYIVDLCQNRGGSLHTSAYLASFFLPPRTPLWSLLDRDGDVIEAYESTVIQASKSVGEAPLYVLVSENTFSAAEYFIWAMQRNERAIVIGEKTKGGAHSIEDIKIDQYFVLRTPVGRPLIEEGESNWQAVGLRPHILVPSESALAEAEKHLRSSL